LFDVFQPQDDWLMALITWWIEPLFFGRADSLDYADAKWTPGRLKTAAVC
jgi:hypothetical protein